MTTSLIEQEPGIIQFVPDLVEVSSDRLCAYCHLPMVDGGAPLPGEGKLNPAPRACASCWALMLQPEGTRPVVAEIVLEGSSILCHHGISFDEPCKACEDEIIDGTLPSMEIID
jgi:hypothetical protein